MDYKELGHIYYSDHELYEIMYKRRFSSIYTHHINFDIREWPAFFVVTPEIQSLMISIRKADKKVYQLCRDLPNKAIEQFSLRCLVDEIVLELFSEHGISTMDLIHYLGVSRGTVNTKLMKIEEAGFLKKNHIKRENFFGIDLQALDRYVDA